MDGTVGKNRARLRLVRQFDTLTFAGKNDSVVAHDRTAAQSVDSDLFAGTLTDYTRTPVALHTAILPAGGFNHL